MILKVGIAMSGGVDSAVAASLLLERGYHVTAYHMKNLPESLYEGFEENKKLCCSPADRRDAFAIAKGLGIELKLVSLAEAFQQLVIDYFIRGYCHAETPNPCVVCNDRLKFGLLMEKALEDGVDLFSSGHYARIIDHPSLGKALSRGIHPEKDQSYALARLKREKLNRLILPNGEFTKDQIRRRAEELGLPVHDKKDSQELCFIPDNDYRRFLDEAGIKSIPGKIIDSHGRILGVHRGLPFYTVGQRRGLGITATERLYVLRLDHENNAIVVGPVSETFSMSLTVKNLNWLVVNTESDFRCECMIRSTMKPVPARVCVQGTTVKLHFEEPVQFVTPGQLAVFFDRDIVLGSGFII